jgi:8-oxo-dGTP diphosphatase
MNTIENEVKRLFGGKVRMRVCGLCRRGDCILLVKHEGIGPLGYLWAPPGGGVDFGESLQEALAREITEETHLQAEVKEFRFVHEFVGSNLHAVELFFIAESVQGEPLLGRDPEMEGTRQMLTEVAFVPFSLIQQGDRLAYHYMFSQVNSLDELMTLQGYFRQAH